MPFNFLEGDGEFQFKSHPLKMGDIFQFLGDSKKLTYLVVDEPKELTERARWLSSSGKEQYFREYVVIVYSLTENKRYSLQVDNSTCYRLLMDVQ